MSIHHCPCQRLAQKDHLYPVTSFSVYGRFCQSALMISPALHRLLRRAIISTLVPAPTSLQSFRLDLFFPGWSQILCLSLTIHSPSPSQSCGALLSRPFQPRPLILTSFSLLNDQDHPQHSKCISSAILAISHCGTALNTFSHPRNSTRWALQYFKLRT